MIHLLLSRQEAATYLVCARPVGYSMRTFSRSFQTLSWIRLKMLAPRQQTLFGHTVVYITPPQQLIDNWKAAQKFSHIAVIQQGKNLILL
jgi:hypothetical protein